MTSHSFHITHESIQDFDRHIDNLRAQLQYLNEGLEATDYNAPDWLATDLISLRNKSGRLQDDMKRFRDQLQSEGLAVKKVRGDAPATKAHVLTVTGQSKQTPQYRRRKASYARQEHAEAVEWRCITSRRPESYTTREAHPAR